MHFSFKFVFHELDKYLKKCYNIYRNKKINQIIMTEKQTHKSELAPEGSLAEFREKFGTLLSKTASSSYHRNYRDTGERILINTTSKSVRGPRTGKSWAGEEEPGTAFVDFALEPEVAEKLYEQLGRSIKEWKENKKD